MSYTSDFLVWWKDFWVSTPGMSPSEEAKAAAWAGWQAGREREHSVWGSSARPEEAGTVVGTQDGLTPTGRYIADCERDAKRYRWLNKQHNFLVYIEDDDGKRQRLLLRCGVPLDEWLDSRIKEEAERLPQQR